MDRADLVLHPVRVNILRELSDGRQRTPQEVAESLRDVPPATLYRHIAMLVDGGVLRVVGMRRARGAPERVLELVPHAVRFSSEEFRKFTRAEMRRYFMAFVGSVIDAGVRFIASRGARGDELRYRMEVAHMTDEEAAAFLEERDALFARALARPATPGRRPRVLAVFSFPQVGNGAAAKKAGGAALEEIEVLRRLHAGKPGKDE
jgi:DNA-binding transcriptional ArsR family regulator